MVKYAQSKKIYPNCAKIVLFNKPFGVHSQFRKDNAMMPTLADFFVDKSLRVAGRLDADSEGLLLLSNHGKLIHMMTTPPSHAHHSTKQAKTYLVQVEGMPSQDALAKLRQGVMLKDGKTLPAVVEHLHDDDLPIALWVRTPPIRERKSIPTAWLSIRIVEGKNRQIRRMTAHVGLPCLRLIRYQIGGWTLNHAGGQLLVGQSLRMTLDDNKLRQLGIACAPYRA